MKYSKARIYYDNQSEYNLLQTNGIVLDHVKMKRDVFIESDFSSSDINMARKLGFKVKILIDDVQEYYINRNLLETANEKSLNNLCSNNNLTYQTPINYNHGSMGGYLTYDEMLSELDDMYAQYPNLITPKSLLNQN